MNNDNNGSNGNKGNRGRFSDRLKLMRIQRLKRRKGLIIENTKDNAIKDAGRNVLKLVLALPSVVYTNIINNNEVEKNKDNVENRKQQNVNKNNDSRKNIRAKNSHTNGSVLIDSSLLNMDDNLEIYNVDVRSQLNHIDKKNKIDEIKNIDVSILRRKREALLQKSNLPSGSDIKDINKELELEYKKVKLQKEIIDLIKKKLVTSINELEVLQSELYVLNQLEMGDIYLSECQQDIKEIKKLLSKVKSLKEKYDHLKENVDFEYMLEYGDDFLIDKILELKEICSRDDIRHTVDDYKILNEYKFLYLKIDKLQEDAIKFEEEKSKKVEELKQRDIDFDKLKNDIYDVDRENDRYNLFVKEQELFLRELENNIFKIESHEDVTYRLKGFNQLLGNSFKYLGLLLVNPLKGLIPGIATQTLVTKNVVQNLYNNLEWEETRRMVYESIDYSSSINAAINNLDSTASLVDSTLEDIIRLKNKYMKDFSGYEGSFSSYHDAIKKINKIENAVLGNKIKIEMMRQRMKEKERENNNKLKMVKKLNDSSNG